MKKFYSKINPALLLHQIHKFEDFQQGRTDFSDPKDYLQAASICPELDKTVPPHKHLWKSGCESVITQEAWIVISGQLKCAYYDTDDSFLGEEVLRRGDCSITFQGGHSLTPIEENTLFYEIKTGPYTGKENDRRAI